MINWKYYNGALLLDGRPPHADNKDITVDDAKKALKSLGGYFCRWTTDFDCGEETSWWYCIKDAPIDINKLTSKQRYRVNKGLKYWDTIQLHEDEIKKYSEQLFEVAIDCFKEYPAKYRPKLDYSTFCEEIKKGVIENDYWALIDKESKQLHGYAVCGIDKDYVSLSAVKIRPEVFKLEPNAAIAYELCRYYINDKGYKYICDGERNIRHETSYQDFLCRVLDFRLAYCHLNLVYSNKVNNILFFMRPFYRLFEWGGRFSQLLYNIYSLIKQDRIYRNKSI